MIEIDNKKKKMIRHGTKLEKKKRKKVKEMINSNIPPIIVDPSPHHYVALTKPLQLKRQNIIFCGGRGQTRLLILMVIFYVKYIFFLKKKLYIKISNYPSTG